MRDRLTGRVRQIHVVHFDAARKIRQIRLYWDQGSLLKQIDVIGSRGRNWPIRDGKEQAHLIATKSPADMQTEAAPPAPVAGKSRSQSNNVTRDPHASLSLFAPRDEVAQEPQSKPVAPRAIASAKPPPRDYHDLFVGNDSDSSPRPLNAGPSSPKKENAGMKPPPPKSQIAKPPARDYHDLFVSNDSGNSANAENHVTISEKLILSPGSVAPKGGSGKNFRPNRLFDTHEDEPNTPKSPDKLGYKTNPNKFNHFDFGNGEDAKAAGGPRPKTKHQSQWDFDDFNTPVKPALKIRDQDKRNFTLEDEEPAIDRPVKDPTIPKARPDADPHFEFQDAGTPDDGRHTAGQPRGAGNVRSTGLYHDNLFGDNSPSPEKSKPLAPVTNLQDRRKDFDPHFTMTDSPSGDLPKETHKNISEARKKVVSQMGAQWEARDESPGSNVPMHQRARSAGMSGNKENILGDEAAHLGIKSTGDGMGGKKGASRNWGFGDDSGDEEVAFHASKKQQGPKENRLWDF